MGRWGEQKVVCLTGTGYKPIAMAVCRKGNLRDRITSSPLAKDLMLTNNNTTFREFSAPYINCDNFCSRLPIPTPDSRLPTPDSRLPTPDSRLPTPDSRLPTPDSRLPTPINPARKPSPH
ncbi:hypothetical protein [Moorena producens]|uniref:hypothetical protein n=1 Tax=Moorena producens TaxID=1155739 RepID=UPI000A96E0F5|nr:hypothetical protein [Moorena producens]